MNLIVLSIEFVKCLLPSISIEISKKQRYSNQSALGCSHSTHPTASDALVELLPPGSYFRFVVRSSGLTQLSRNAGKA
jgi:hypothetical protein